MGRGGTSTSTGLAVPSGKVSLTDYRSNYDTMSAEDRASLEQSVGKILGGNKTIAHVLAATGAPKGSAVQIKSWGDTYIITQLDESGIQMDRTIAIDAQGRSFVHNDYFSITDKGKGKGAKIFNDQVKAAAKAGFKYIETDAASGGNLNGYYTWPRLGYDAEIPAAPRYFLPPELKGATRVSDLMKTPEGRAWWKDNGSTVTDAKFDLTPGSQSRQVLDAYIKGK